MNKVLIVGGGFAGLSALAVLAQKKDNFEVVLIDKKNTFDFLPALPDVIGGRLNPENLKFSLSDFCYKFSCQFVNDTVKSIDFDRKRVELVGSKIEYDYLVINCSNDPWKSMKRLVVIYIITNGFQQIIRCHNSG